MKKFFGNDSVLKVFSFIIAIIIWFYIIVVLDPPVEMTIRDIPIRYIQQNALLEQGLSIVGESKGTVEIKLKGSRKRLVNIDSGNILATVDLSSITKAGKHSLPVNLSVPYEYLEVVSKKPYNVDVTIDKLVEEKRNIRVKTSGSPEAGFIAGDAETNPKTVLLKGAASVISRIADVRVSLDIANASEDLKTTAKIELVDADGKVIEDNNEIMELISSDINKAEVFCPIMRLKTVPIKANCDLELPEGASLSVQPNTITIYGYEEDVEGVEEILTAKITSLSEIKDGKTINCGIILPENIKPRDDVSTVNVKMSIAE